MPAFQVSGSKEIITAQFTGNLYADYERLAIEKTPENTEKLLRTIWDTVSQERFSLSPGLFNQLATLVKDVSSDTDCKNVINDFLVSNMPIFFAYLHQLSENQSASGLQALAGWIRECDLWERLQSVLKQYPATQQPFMDCVDKHSHSHSYNPDLYDPEQLDTPFEDEASWNPAMKLFARRPAIKPLQDIRNSLARDKN